MLINDGRSLALLVGWRYLFSKDIALSFVTKTATIGLVISIAILLVVQGVVAGFQRDLRENVLGLVPHVYLSSSTGVEENLGELVAGEIKSVTDFAMVRQSIGLLSTETNVQRTQIIGLETNIDSTFNKLSEFVVDGDWEQIQPRSYRMILGSGLARSMQVELGDQVMLTLAESSITPIGLFPRLKRFEVAGLIQTDSILDSRVAYVHRDDLVRLSKASTPSNAAYFRIENPLEASRTALSIYGAASNSSYQIGSWEGVFGALYHFLQQFKNLLFILIALLVGVAIFNLVSSLVMLVQSRRHDIAVFRTLGGNTALILASFLLTGILTVCVGLVIGGLIAWILGLLLPYAHLWLSEFLGVSLSQGFPLHRLTVEITVSDWLRVLGLTFVAATLGALYPAWRACQLNPVEILRDE